MSDLPWRVVTVPWELKEVMLGWVSERVSKRLHSRQASLQV